MLHTLKDLDINPAPITGFKLCRVENNKLYGLHQSQYQYHLYNKETGPFKTDYISDCNGLWAVFNKGFFHFFKDIPAKNELRAWNFITKAKLILVPVEVPESTLYATNNIEFAARFLKVMPIVKNNNDLILIKQIHNDNLVTCDAIIEGQFYNDITYQSTNIINSKLASFYESYYFNLKRNIALQHSYCYLFYGSYH